MSYAQAALRALPSTPNNIPAFFFSHGSPMLAMAVSNTGGPRQSAMTQMGSRGPLAEFLREFGPTLLEKYQPKGILVFSAHWETCGERLVTDYGIENPLLMDYFGFSDDMYKLKFTSRGDTLLAQRVVSLFQQAGLKARTSPRDETRGDDGRGFEGPGLDHGVFVPFRLMFGEHFTDIPIVQASIDGNLKPEDNWKIGEAVRKLRREGILILSGGLVIHNLRDFSAFSPDAAAPPYKAFDKAIHEAIAVPEPEDRKKALVDLTRHPGFRAAHPREEHFVPLYVAAGAGTADSESEIPEGQIKTLSDRYGIPTFAFGVTGL
ncbi:hypothetical protein HGRIS_013465 [Hohenbuehelia grisea]|uniref:Extradiol ring-cleavage dioxygenase class III enzyme subunit B domain-containing protein n=1 Tax=Hohenbuehelia grisea TaxID=104357 RepID=A0ABR3IVN7_9AGAR